MVRNGSVSDLLALLPPTELRSLLPAGGLLTWQRLAVALPLALSSHLLLECPLAAPDGLPDLHLAVTRRQALASFPCACLEGDPLLTDFMGRWLDGPVGVGQQVSHIWLSFDFAGDRLLQPLLYLHSAQVTARTVLFHLSPLLEPQAAAVLQRSLEAVVQRPTYVGLVRRRGTAPQTRLIWSVPPADAPQLLQQVGWPGSLEPVTPWLDAIAGLGGQVGLVLNFSEQVLPQLGLEFMNSREHRDRSRWRQALGRLVRAGLATRAQQDELLTFAGFLTEEAGWPCSLRVEPALRRQKVSLLERRLSHLKLRFGPGERPAATVYLSLKHGWLPRLMTRVGDR